jgi:Fic family protein
MRYQPPYTITSKIIHLIAQISENIGRLTVLEEIQDSLKLRKANRIRTIQGSLAIEGNTLSTEQITAILNGKTVIAPPKKYRKCVMPLKPMKPFSSGNQAKKKTYYKRIKF